MMQVAKVMRTRARVMSLPKLDARVEIRWSLGARSATSGHHACRASCSQAFVRFRRQERTRELALVESNGEVEAGEWRKKGDVAEKRLSQSLMSSKLIVRVSMRTEPKEEDLSLSAQASRMGQSAWDPWRSIFMMHRWSQRNCRPGRGSFRIELSQAKVERVFSGGPINETNEMEESDQVSDYHLRGMYRDVVEGKDRVEGSSMREG